MNRKLPLTVDEKIIREKSAILPNNQSDNAWLDSSAFADLIQAWASLAWAYDAGDNTVISVETVHHYLDLKKRLHKVAAEPNNEQRRQQALTALNSLEGFMVEIVKQASRALNNLDDIL